MQAQILCELSQWRTFHSHGVYGQDLACCEAALAFESPVLDDVLYEGIDNSVLKIRGLQLLRHLVQVQAPGELDEVGLLRKDQTCVQKFCVYCEVFDCDVWEVDRLVFLGNCTLRVHCYGEVIGAVAQGIAVQYERLAFRLGPDVYMNYAREVAASISKEHIERVGPYLGPADVLRRTFGGGLSGVELVVSVMIAGFEHDLSISRRARSEVATQAVDRRREVGRKRE